MNADVPSGHFSVPALFQTTVSESEDSITNTDADTHIYIDVYLQVSDLQSPR